MHILNGTTSMYMTVWYILGLWIIADASPVGGGGICQQRYFHFKFPDLIIYEVHINSHLE